MKKKKGQKRGAIAYSEGDLVAILDIVEHVLLQQDDDWKKVQHEYKLYAEKYSHAQRSENALKSKFWELVWGTPSGGGSRNHHEQRAKKIMGDIDILLGIRRSDLDGTISTSTSASTSASASTSSPFHVGSCAKFQCDLIMYLDQSE